MMREDTKLGIYIYIYIYIYIFFLQGNQYMYLSQRKIR